PWSPPWPPSFRRPPPWPPLFWPLLFWPPLFWALPRPPFPESPAPGRIQPGQTGPGPVLAPGVPVVEGCPPAGVGPGGSGLGVPVPAPPGRDTPNFTRVRRLVPLTRTTVGPVSSLIQSWPFWTSSEINAGVPTEATGTGAANLRAAGSKSQTTPAAESGT